ncbi:MAG: stage II sporulation protein M [Planctomycetaceae bacterium]
MNKRQFVRQRKSAWARFTELLGRAGRVSTNKLQHHELAEYSRLFRELSNDLATVRSHDWGQSLETYLNHLVGRGHNTFYSAPPGNFRLVLRYLSVDFPRLFRANFGYFLAAFVLFFVSGGISWAVIQHDPTLAARVIPNEQLKQFDEMYGDREPNEVGESGEPGQSPSDKKDAEGGPPSKKKSDKDAKSEDPADKKAADEFQKNFGEQRALMAGFYISHNVGIALDCFARGILLGIGTIYTLLFNGIVLGAVGGYMISQGHSERFLSFVISHGAFELTAIAVAGAAGLMLGNALLHPGSHGRLESLRVRALDAVQVAAGAAAMLVVAALIEAFWSPAGIPAVAKYIVGTGLWVAVFLYLAFSGRGR